MKIKALPLGFLSANCYLVWDGVSADAAVIDPGAQPKRILQALADEGLICKVILLTHGHHDHIEAAPGVQEATGAPVYVHNDDHIWLADPSISRFPFSPRYHPPGETISVEDGFSLTVGTLTFTCKHTPGHSPGSCIWMTAHTQDNAESKRPVWFSGDTLFRFEIGRLDLHGGSPGAMRKTLESINAERVDADVYPGHGEPTTLLEEQRRNPYLRGAPF